MTKDYWTDTERMRQELEQKTGLRIDVPENCDAGKAAETLKRLLLASEQSDNDQERELLLKLLTQELPREEQAAALRGLGLSAESSFAVFLIELPGKKSSVDEPVAAVLRELFGQGPGDIFLEIEDGRILFLHCLGEPGIPGMAEALLETLNMELMLEAKIACSRPHPGEELHVAYAEAKKALEVGLMFSDSERICYYDCLGMRRLIFDLPREACLAYLDEIFDGEAPDHLEDELILTARAFFENGMNISDTAKQLFVHRNTLIYRLEKLYRATGLDIRRFEDAFAFRNAALIYERLRGGR